jgi:hypothetical protein
VVNAVYEVSVAVSKLQGEGCLVIARWNWAWVFIWRTKEPFFSRKSRMRGLGVGGLRLRQDGEGHLDSLDSIYL